MFFWLRSSLKRRLILTLSILFVVMIAIISIFSYSHTSNTIRQDAERYSEQILGQATLNLARYYRDNELFFNTIASSAEFRQWLLTEQVEKYSLFSHMKDLQTRYIEPYITYHPEIISVILNNVNGTETIYRSANPGINVILKHEYATEQEAWFHKIEQDGQLVRFINQSDRYADAYGRIQQVPVMTFVQKLKFQKQEGFLIMDISLQPTTEILQAIHMGDRATPMISDENDMLVAHPDDTLIGKPLPDFIRGQLKKSSGNFFAKEANQLVVYQTVPGSNWKMIVQVPYEEIARSSFVVRNFTLIVAGICLLIGLLFVVWIADSITRRIKQLKETIKHTETGNFNIRVPITGVDEVSSLAKTYNHLMAWIDTSVHDLAEAKIVHQRAILSALQSQINSHFLYNALESINSMANIAGHADIRQTTISLSKLLRYTSNYRETMVALRDEMNCLNDYMHIITIVYGEMIVYSIDVAEELEEVVCLKALLQPIVENCIKHGYEITGEKLLIEVNAREMDDGYVCISIIDNGPGLTPSKRDQIRRKLDNKNPEREFNELDRVGLLNLHYRLKMVYPDVRSGIVIPEQPLDQGTVIQIWFPMRKGLSLS